MAEPVTRYLAQEFGTRFMMSLLIIIIEIICLPIFQYVEGLLGVWQTFDWFSCF